MSNLSTFAGGQSPFAHLAGIARGKSKAETDEDQKKRDDEAKAKKAAEDGDDGGDDAAKGSKAGGSDDQDDADDGKAKGKKAADDGDGEDDASASKRGKKAADDGDEEDGEDDETDAKAKSARRRERARCAAIFSSPLAGVNPVGAAHLAFTTGMSSRTALGMLAAIGTGASAQEPTKVPQARRSIDQRMAQVPTPDVGTDGGSQAPAGMSPAAQKIIAANKVRHGQT